MVLGDWLNYNFSLTFMWVSLSSSIYKDVFPFHFSVLDIVQFITKISQSLIVICIGVGWVVEGMLLLEEGWWGRCCHLFKVKSGWRCWETFIDIFLMCLGRYFRVEHWYTLAQTSHRNAIWFRHAGFEPRIIETTAQSAHHMTKQPFSWSKPSSFI